MTVTLAEIESQASAAAGGLDDFGHDHREGLQVLLDAAAVSPHSGAMLDARIRHSAIGALVSRLHSRAGWSARPASLDAPLPPQLVVIGLPRTGTTALHQILAADPTHQWVPAWMVAAPKVRPPVDAWPDDPDHRSAVEAHAGTGPNALHDVRPDDPEECLMLMRQSFTSMLWVSSMAVPDYHEWFIGQDERPSYRALADNLRLIGAESPGRTWLLKNPSHTFGLGAMFDEFPEAVFVHIHREPTETIVSGCSLIASMGLGEGTFTPDELGAHRLRIWALAAERMDAARAAAPHRTVIDVAYPRFVADGIGTVRAIYEQLGRELTADAEAAMTSWAQARPKDQHGAHRYAAEDFGLTTEMISDRMAEYIETYVRPGKGVGQR